MKKNIGVVLLWLLAIASCILGVLSIVDSESVVLAILCVAFPPLVPIIGFVNIVTAIGYSLYSFLC